MGVELRGLRKSFGPVAAVDGVDLDVDTGDVMAVLGPSGCGKTTTLRLIAGFETPDAGTIRVGGRTVVGDGIMVPAERRNVGMLFQQLALFPHLDVARNVAYGVRGSRDQRRRRVGELLELVGMSGYQSRFPDELSGGQAQRVALARALAPSPEVVLLDEPFSSLDVTLRAGVRREVRGILEAARATALLVTHDQDEALAMGDRVAVMLAGRVVQVGSPEEVYRAPVSTDVAAFLGDANLLPGRLVGEHIETEVGMLRLVPGTVRDTNDAWALVRPEDLDLEQVENGTSTVVDVEYYGHDQLVTVALPSGRRVRARLHARHRFSEGCAVAVRTGSLGIVAFPMSDAR